VTGHADGRHARREATQRLILDAAAGLFADQGYTGTSVDQIADAAGVSKGAIFYNFDSKAGVFAELIHRSSAAFGGRLEQAREGRRGWPALEAVTLEILRDVDSHPAFVQILQSELFRTGRPWADVIGDARARFLGPIIEVLREVADERVTAGLTRELPPRSVTDSVAASLLGALAVAALDRRVHAAERTVEDVHAGLLQAISGLRA
jgi:AcrR family transcriptional regulator